MRRILCTVVYAVLVVVVGSCLRSVWIGLTDADRYQAAFPGAHGALLWATLLASFLAAANAILIGLRTRWAILANPLIGLVYITLLEVVDGPASSQVIVVMATALSTAIPWYLWVGWPIAQRARST